VKSEIFCHVGMQKAGSKAIQHFSAQNHEALRERGIHYPREVNRGAWHRKLFLDYDAEMDAMVHRLSCTGERLVLSYEKAYVAPDAIIERLAAHGSALHVLVLVREPVSWVNSWINQVVKAHRSTYRHFANFSVDNQGISDVLSIDRHLARWEAFTPAERITAVEYDPGADVLGAYLDWLGIADGAGNGFDTTPGDPNRALDARSIRVVLEVKRRLAGADRSVSARAMRRVHQRLAREPAQSSEPFRLVDDATAERIVQRFQPAFDAVMARYGRNGGVTDFGKTREALLSRRVLREFDPRPDEAEIARRIAHGV